MSDLLFPEAEHVLAEVIERHLSPLCFAYEAIDLAYRADTRQRDFASSFVPGVPGIRRFRNDINDTAWRYFRSLADPLISESQIASFTTVEGGDVMILPDGLHTRIKKGTRSGATSNYRTGRVLRMAAESHPSLFSAATPLDMAIQDGVMIDIVFVAGETMDSFEQIGIRFAAVEVSPFLILNQPTEAQLQGISPIGFELVVDARNKLLA